MKLLEAINKADEYGRLVKTSAGLMPVPEFRQTMEPFHSEDKWTFDLALSAPGDEDPPRIGSIRSCSGRSFESVFPVY
jgi:hypothetical protein